LHDPSFNPSWDIGGLKAENRQFCLPWDRNPGQGSLKVIDPGTNGKRMYTFLLVINSNFSPSCTVSVIWRLKFRKSPILLTHPHLAPLLWGTLRISGLNLLSKN